ncbi:unnamed protein product, partial [Mesorhabditis belari]|uniref:Uncharacterized protein n=1 Tax=Mesorhabditis belari TaxID=2138241 RepID=A0AAF3ENQ4_9BILA
MPYSQARRFQNGNITNFVYAENVIIQQDSHGRGRRHQSQDRRGGNKFNNYHNRKSRSLPRLNVEAPPSYNQAISHQRKREVICTNSLKITSHPLVWGKLQIVEIENFSGDDQSLRFHGHRCRCSHKGYNLWSGRRLRVQVHGCDEFDEDSELRIKTTPTDELDGEPERITIRMGC